MLHKFSRTELLIGDIGLEKLAKSKVAIFGIGGVGSYAVEGLARSGIENFVLIDDDKICLTNINRQIHATTKTVGTPKVEAMEARILEINPKANVQIQQQFYTADTSDSLIDDDLDYIIDAVDTVSSKIDLVLKANQKNIPIISSMGAGNKLDPTKFEITDLFKTSVCPLARVMRYELKKRNIKKLKVVYSKETPLVPIASETNNCNKSCICPKGTIRKCSAKRQIPGSISFVPSVVGLIIASEVVKDLLK